MQMLGTIPLSLSYAHTNPGPPSLGSFHLLLQSEAQVVAGRLDLVLGLQVGHGVCVDAINGHHKISLAELGLGCLAAWSDLVKQAEEGVSQGRKDHLELPVHTRVSFICDGQHWLLTRTVFSSSHGYYFLGLFNSSRRTSFGHWNAGGTHTTVGSFPRNHHQKPAHCLLTKCIGLREHRFERRSVKLLIGRALDARVTTWSRVGVPGFVNEE